MANSGLTRVWVDVDSSIDFDVAANGHHVAIVLTKDGKGGVVHLPAVTFCRLLDRMALVPNEIRVNQRLNGGPLDMCPDVVWSFVRRYIPGASIPAWEASRRAMYSAVVYVLVNGVPWQKLPATFGVHYTAAWRRCRDWRSAGLFAHIYRQSCTVGHIPDLIRVHCQEVSDAARTRTKGDDHGNGRHMPDGG